MNISVTKADIQKATKRDCQKCTVAVAIARITKAVDVWVDNVFHIRIKEKEYRVVESDIVRIADRIGGFDNGAEVDEFSFEILEW